MPAKIRWTPAKYRDALLGRREDGIIGLRSVATGFKPSEGFDLRHVKDWTAAQRRRVRDMARAARLLTEQPKRIVRARGENLRKLQTAFHGQVPSSRFKVAFVPDVFPEALHPGLKRPAPKIRVRATDVLIQHKDFGRTLVPFDKRALARNARKEIMRALSVFPPRTKDFAIQCERNVTLSTAGPERTLAEVIRLMQRYNGVDPIPRGSKNAGSDPRKHKWDQWLVGLVGYTFKPRANVRSIVRKINAGLDQIEELRERRKRYLRRKNGKKQTHNRR